MRGEVEAQFKREKCRITQFIERDRMSNYPFVSIVVPVLNDWNALAHCLKALRSQTYPQERFETVIIDNGSTERPPLDLELSPNTRLINEPKASVYAARNAGIRQARGEVIAFTDADCIPDHKWLACGVRSLLARPEAGLVAGRITLFFRDPLQPTASELYEAAFVLNQKRNVDQNTYAVTANVFTYKYIFDLVGTFNEAFRSAGDREWSNRVALSGYQLVYAEEASVSHPTSASLAEVLSRAPHVGAATFPRR
jgi:glycosyltransferase involved in cell wall biosynthesis